MPSLLTRTVLRGQVFLRGLAFLTLLWATLFAVHLFAPLDVMSRSQDLQAAYVVDAAVNGHWLVQHDVTGQFASKPPLYTWLAAVAWRLTGGQAPIFALFVPGALALLILTLALWRMGSGFFSPAGGLLAGFMMLLSPAGGRIIFLARTDGLFTCLVALTALAAFSAWYARTSWLPFWLFAALATLTKGPLGLIFALMGFCALPWMSARPPAAVSLSSQTSGSGRGFWLGFSMYGGLVAGWFLLALVQEGPELAHWLLGRELVGHVTGATGGKTWGAGFYHPCEFVIGQFLPWSIPGSIALWRVFRHPAKLAKQQCFERFLAAWLLGGLALLMFSAHQKSQLVFPLLPPLALLAGREVARWLGTPVPSRRLTGLTVSVGLGAVAIVAGYLYGYHPVANGRNQDLQQTAALQKLTAEFNQIVGREAILETVDAPYILQFFRKSMRPQLGYNEAAARLAKTGNHPCYVAVNDLEPLRSLLPPGLTVRVVASTPANNGFPQTNIVTADHGDPGKALP